MRSIEPGTQGQTNSPRPLGSGFALRAPRNDEVKQRDALNLSPAHRYRRAIRRGGAVAAEPGDGAGDFIGGDEAALRVLGVERGFGFVFAELGFAGDVLGGAGDDVGFDVARANGV